MVDMYELKELIEKTGEGIDAFKKSMHAKIDNERKEREELELRLQRGGRPLHGKSAGSDDEHKALAVFARTGEDAELKTMSVGSDPDGGYIVLPVMASTMITKIYDQSAIARLARRETISAGDAWEEVTDFDEAGASWTGETSSRDDTGTPQIGKIRIPVHEIYALQTVTQRLLDDTSYDLGAWIEAKISDKFGRAEGIAFIDGDGVLKPRGFLSYNIVATADASRDYGDIEYVKTGHASAFASTSPADCLISMVYKLRAPYKQGNKVAWVMNSTTAATIRKFKDLEGRYIWTDALTAGQPPMLLGFPVELDESMPDLGANAYPIALANWSLAYRIVDKPGIRMVRDPYTAKPYVKFYAYRRVGGGLANSEAIKLLKCEL
ncbi:MAG: phage major capsid protein [Hyphomicrobiales bacterium]